MPPFARYIMPENEKNQEVFMDGYTFHTHAVYRDRNSGGSVLLVHHNPMALRSLLLHRNGTGFDWTAPVPVGVDTIIEMRRSGSFEELPSLPENEIRQLLENLLASSGLSAEDAPFVRALLEQK